MTFVFSLIVSVSQKVGAWYRILNCFLRSSCFLHLSYSFSFPFLQFFYHQLRCYIFFLNKFSYFIMCHYYYHTLVLLLLSSPSGYNFFVPHFTFNRVSHNPLEFKRFIDFEKNWLPVLIPPPFLLDPQRLVLQNET